MVIKDLLSLSLKSILGFLALLILTRALGKRNISQLTHFDYVTGITIGSIAASWAVDPSVSSLSAIWSLSIWGVLTMLMTRVTLKNRRARKILDGEPTLVVAEGRILEENMRRMHYNIDDLNEQLREKDVFHLTDVEFAVLETSGRLSVLKKTDVQPASRKDLKVPAPVEGIPVELVVDGEVIRDNLRQVNLTDDMLMAQLQAQGIRDVKEVTFACLDRQGHLYVDKRKDALRATPDITD